MRESAGLDRFLTFIDAIVAIAVTLLILPLVELTDEAASESFSELISSDVAGARIASFLLSFLVIFRLWRIHHRLHQGVGAHDRFLVSVSMFWALTIVILPFPTALIAEYGSDRGAMALYLVNLLLSSACLTALSVYLARRPHLRGEDAGPARSAAPAVVSTGLLVLATAVALLVPAIGYGALFLLLLTGLLTKLWERRAAGT